MRDRIWNIIAAILGFALFAFAMFVGCRALHRNPALWLCVAIVFLPVAAFAPSSPRGAETFAAPTMSVTLAWNGSQNAEGYRVYYRKAGQNYMRWQDAGSNMTLRIVGLERKTTYRFVATAYRNNYESGPSNEVSYRTPFSHSDR